MELPLCEDCRERPATVYVKLRVGSQQHEMRLCAECAANHQALAFPFSIGVSQDGQIGISFAAPALEAPPPLPAEQCRTCGLTSAEFSESGSLGCADCYQGLSQTIRLALERSGEPGQALVPDPPDSEVLRLQLELADAVVNEDYVRAAHLRDEIKALQS